VKSNESDKRTTKVAADTADQGSQAADHGLLVDCGLCSNRKGGCGEKI